MFRNKLFRVMPLMDANGGGGTGGAGTGSTDTGGAGQSQNQGAGQASGQVPEIDYDKLAGIIAGKQQASENAILKAHFKNQGLSPEEAAQAIAAFKEQKAKNTPDVAAIQQQSQQFQAQALQSEMEKEALLMAGELGVDMKLVPYLMKLANVEEVVTENKIDKEKLKASLEKVLEDVPQLKVSQDQNNTSGVRFGASRQDQSGAQDDDVLKAAFGL